MHLDYENLQMCGLDWIGSVWEIKSEFRSDPIKNGGFQLLVCSVFSLFGSVCQFWLDWIEYEHPYQIPWEIDYATDSNQNTEISYCLFFSKYFIVSYCLLFFWMFYFDSWILRFNYGYYCFSKCRWSIMSSSYYFSLTIWFLCHITSNQFNFCNNKKFNQS